MEEIEERKGRISRNRRPIAVCLILFVIFIIPMTPLLLIIQQSFYVSRFVSISIGPFDEEMSINLDFYNSNADIETGEDSIAGYGRRLDPSDSIQTFGFSISLLWNADSVWVSVYFDQPSGTPPSVIRSIDIGGSATFTLRNIEISLTLQR